MEVRAAASGGGLGGSPAARERSGRRFAGWRGRLGARGGQVARVDPTLSGLPPDWLESAQDSMQSGPRRRSSSAQSPLE
jgi:hypothetical protein